MGRLSSRTSPHGRAGLGHSFHSRQLEAGVTPAVTSPPLPSICSGQSFAVCTAVRFQAAFFSPKEYIGLVSNSPRPDRKLIAAWPFRTRPLGNSPRHLPVWRVFLPSLRTTIFAFPFLSFCDEHFPAVVNRNEPFPLLNILCFFALPPGFKEKLVFIWGKSKKASAGFQSTAARLCYHQSESSSATPPPPRFSKAQGLWLTPLVHYSKERTRNF